MQPIKPIETVYRGFRFRSRLEARWAVFFDSMGIEWEYEKEGFDLGDVGYYLPDFWLPQVDMWAEVKPKTRSTMAEGWEWRRKAEALARATQHPVLLLIGLPDFQVYRALEMESEHARGVDGDRRICPIPYVVTTADGHGYVFHEHRFYSMPGDEDTGDGLLDAPEYSLAVYAARQARFEHGERG